MSDIVPGVIRVLVSSVVGWVAAWGTTVGVDVDQAGLTTALTLIFTLTWYILARLVELRWPNARVLGTKKVPTYVDGGLTLKDLDQ